LPAQLDSEATVTYGGYLYSLGGRLSTGDYDFTAAVSYAKINTDGSLGAWQAATSLPQLTTVTSAVAYNGYLYEIGGYTHEQSDSVADVHYAKINTDGSLGAWQATTSLPTKNEEAVAFQHGGYIYEISGSQGGYDARDVVYYAKINTDGSLGAWQVSTNTLATAVVAATGGVWNGYAYIVGGYDGDDLSKVVQYAKLNADGSVGEWKTTSELPAGTVAATGVISNGYIYNIAGTSTDFNDTSVITYAKINNDGTVGTWQTATNAFPIEIDTSASVTANGYIYSLGGEDSSGNRLDDVRYARLNFINYQPSLRSPFGQRVELNTPIGTNITCSSTSKENVTQPDSDYTYPLGLVNFCFSTNASSNQVTLTFVTDLTPDQVTVRKYDPVTKKYATVSGAIIIETTAGGKHALQVSYTVVDNGPLDTDPAVGQITDPVGLAVTATPVAPTTGLETQDILPYVVTAATGIALLVVVVIRVRY
jgi:N-acetylneuraminic acid mutarotase